MHQGGWQLHVATATDAVFELHQSCALAAHDQVVTLQPFRVDVLGGKLALALLFAKLGFKLLGPAVQHHHVLIDGRLFFDEIGFAYRNAGLEGIKLLHQGQLLVLKPGNLRLHVRDLGLHGLKFTVGLDIQLLLPELGNLLLARLHIKLLLLDLGEFALHTLVCGLKRLLVLVQAGQFFVLTGRDVAEFTLNGHDLRIQLLNHEQVVDITHKQVSIFRSIGATPYTTGIGSSISNIQHGISNRTRLTSYRW